MPKDEFALACLNVSARYESFSPPFFNGYKHIFMDRKNPQIAAIEFYPKRIADGLILIRDLIVHKFQPEMIILFGSLATGKWTWKSDIDLLIVADTSERPHLELDIKTAILA